VEQLARLRRSDGRFRGQRRPRSPRAFLVTKPGMSAGIQHRSGGDRRAAFPARGFVCASGMPAVVMGCPVSTQRETQNCEPEPTDNGLERKGKVMRGLAITIVAHLRMQRCQDKHLAGHCS